MNNPFIDRKKQLQEKMLFKLEHANNRLEITQQIVDEMQDDVLKNISKAVKDNKMTPYKQAMVFSRVVDGVYKLHRISMDIYDRVAGVAGVETLEEQEAEDSQEKEFAIECEREAEKVLLHIVKNHILTDKEATA